VLAAERLELGGPAGRRDLEDGIGAEARTSMLKRSNNARGRNSGLASRSTMAS